MQTKDGVNHFHFIIMAYWINIGSIGQQSLCRPKNATPVFGEDTTVLHQLSYLLHWTTTSGPFGPLAPKFKKSCHKIIGPNKLS